MADDIAVLLLGNYFTTEYAVAPQSPVTVPAGFDAWQDDAKVQWVRQHASFVLVPGLKDDIDPDTIAVFGRPDHFDGRGIPVVYNDNTAIWETDVGTIEATLRQQTGQTMQQLIDRQENMTTPAQAP